MSLLGLLLLAGEWLCVNVAWRCVEYGQVIPYVGIASLAIGLILCLLSVDRDDPERYE